MKPTYFFDTHPVFRVEEFLAAHREDGSRSAATSQTVLKQHVRAGRLLHVRRGVYAVIPRGQKPEDVVLDPYVLAASLAPDAVVAYHGALQLHGRAHSLSRQVQFLTTTGTKPFGFRGTEFVPVKVPTSLRGLSDLGGGIVDKLRGSSVVRVTTLERTFVDLLDSPRYSGGWEEIWRSLESVEFFDVDAVIDYAFKLGSSVTVAKVGFYLEQHRQELMVEEKHLDLLETRVPSRPAYLERSKRESGKLFSRWNLVVPERIVLRAWEETA
ncbi:MAG: transcriptional regulator [Deltaproteobacteria bacterium]|nr:transcriptional regulator [Deltaproteobacteria bacterium]